LESRAQIVVARRAVRPRNTPHCLEDETALRERAWRRRKQARCRVGARSIVIDSDRIGKDLVDDRPTATDSLTAISCAWVRSTVRHIPPHLQSPPDVIEATGSAALGMSLAAHRSVGGEGRSGPAPGWAELVPTGVGNGGPAGKGDDGGSLALPQARRPGPLVNWTKWARDGRFFVAHVRVTANDKRPPVRCPPWNTSCSGHSAKG